MFVTLYSVSCDKLIKRFFAFMILFVNIIAWSTIMKLNDTKHTKLGIRAASFYYQTK